MTRAARRNPADPDGQGAPPLPRLIAQPVAFPVGPELMAAVVLSPYGGAAPDEIAAFPTYASMAEMDGEAASTSPWHFWRDQGGVTVAFDKPGQAAGAVHVVMELPAGQVPAPWWDLARQWAQLTVLWLPHVRHPTTQEIASALSRRTGWMASARRVSPVALL